MLIDLRLTIDLALRGSARTISITMYLRLPWYLQASHESFLVSCAVAYAPFGLVAFNHDLHQCK